MQNNLINTSILACFVPAICCVLAAQTFPPAVVFHGNCPSKSSSFQEWFRQARLPYIAQGVRKEQILGQCSKLKLQMSLEEVQKVLGKPDFSSPRPTARLATTPESTQPQCNNEIAYILKKSSENMADTEDVAIYLFAEDGKLYWAAPQNLPSLTPLGSPTEGNAPPVVQRQTASWKEYLYADDGFAVTLPSVPVPHKDPANPDINVYTVAFGADPWLSLRVDHQNRDCAATLAELKNGALKDKSGIAPSSIKDVSVGGHAGLEHEYSPAASRISSDRFYCVNGHLYAFSVARPISKFRPVAVDRIINSFRIVNPAARNFAPLSLGDKKPDTGSVSGHVYRNEFFRFTYTFPDDFKPGAISPEAVRFFDGINSFVLLVAGSDQAPPSSGELPSVVKVSAWSEPSLWGDGWREKTGGDYLSRLGTMTNNLEPLEPIKKRTIAGSTFYEADARTNPANPALPRGFQKNLVRTTEVGYILQFVFEARSREELERLDHSIESIHFDSQ